MPDLRIGYLYHFIALCFFLVYFLDRKDRQHQAAALYRGPLQARPPWEESTGRKFSFGLIADLQYADLPDGLGNNGAKRYYRSSLQSLSRAVSHFKQADVAFALHLGDIIDLHNAQVPAAPGSALPRPQQALQEVLKEFKHLDRPVLHALGNHCLSCLPRQELNKQLGIDKLKKGDGGGPATGTHSYYAFVPHPRWRFLVIDGYDVSMLGWKQGHPRYEEAARILGKMNSNEDKNNPDGMEGLDRRFVKFGGGVGEAQLAWLERQLQEARIHRERVVVCSHQCVHPKACPGPWLVWNYERVVELLQAFSDVVMATLAGHAHLDGYHQDEYGIHHRVVKGVVETPPGQDCFGVVDVYPDRLVLKGLGTLASAVWPLQRTGVTWGPGNVDASRERGLQGNDSDSFQGLQSNASDSVRGLQSKGAPGADLGPRQQALTYAFPPN